MEKTKLILHCDCNSFYASVESSFNPHLKNVPMAVGGNESSRHGIILAKNELAKKYNIKTGEPLWKARQKCPNLYVVPPRHDVYAQFSKKVNDIYKEYTNLVEPFGIDESWLDISLIAKDFTEAKEIADEIRNRVKNEIGITVSVGVSFTKVFAKLGSDYKKPDATTVIDKENFKSIVFPLPVEDLLFVGHASLEFFNNNCIYKIGDLAKADKNFLISHLGKKGGDLWNYANGVEEANVISEDEAEEVKSIGNGMTFKRDLIGEDDIKSGVIALSDSITARMRAAEVKCRTIQVTLRDTSFRTVTRQRQLEKPSQLASDVIELSMSIIKDCWLMNNPVRMITITGTNLVSEHEPKQLTLFEDETDKSEEKEKMLAKSVDEIRNKYGKSAIGFGKLLNDDLGINH